MKRKITARAFRRSSGEDENAFDRQFWSSVDAETKFAAAWEMIDEYYLFRGKEGVTQSRLQRSVQNIKRRKR